MTTPALPKKERMDIVATMDGGEKLRLPVVLQEALGDNLDLAKGLLDQVVQISSKGPKPDMERCKSTLARISAVAPQDAVEVMLAIQMAAVHDATMTFSRRLAHVDTIPQQDSAARAFNQLSRTFTAQVEALKRYRSSGQQVVVKHVTVNDGGQAIVGNVSRGEGQT